MPNDKKYVKFWRHSAILLMLLAACSSTAEDNAASGSSAVNDKDSAIMAQASRRRPDAIVKETFTTHCAACHGTDQTGGRAPSLFNQALLDKHTAASIQKIVLNGIQEAGMPPAYNGDTDSAGGSGWWPV